MTTRYFMTAVFGTNFFSNEIGVRRFHYDEDVNFIELLLRG